MKRGLVAVCAVLGLSSPWAQTVAPPGAPASTVVDVVAGIVSYTRWPGDASAIRLCTLGHGPSIEELLRAVDIGSAQRAVASAQRARKAQAVPTVAGEGGAPSMARNGPFSSSHRLRTLPRRAAV